MGDSTASSNVPTYVAQIGAEWLTERAGGLNRYTEGLSRALVAKGVQQRWYVTGSDSLPSGPLVDLRAVAYPTDGLASRLRAFPKAWREAREAPQLVASHFALYALPLRRELQRLPHVCHFHGPWADESAAEGAGRLSVALKRLLERRVYRTADLFVTLSQAFADLLTARYGIDAARIRVVPGGVDCAQFATEATRQEARERLGLPVGRPLVVCVRRLGRRMGIEELLTAMAEVVRAVPDVLLCIAGSGALRHELEEQVAALDLRRHIRLLGFVPDDELPLLYRAADMSIVPSRSLEGFGLITIESLAAGTPVLVTPVGGLPEAVTGLSRDLVLPDSAPPAIAAGLVAALSGATTLPAPEECRRYAVERFDWPVIAGRVLEVYREAIELHG